MTTTLLSNSSGQPLRLSIPAGETSKWFFLGVDATVTLAPGAGGTGAVETTYSTGRIVQADNDRGSSQAVARPWTPGTVSGKAGQKFRRPTAVRFKAVTAAAVATIDRSATTLAAPYADLLAPITIDGVSGLNSVVTAILADGWLATGWQWYRTVNGATTAIGGATLAAYTQQAADVVPGVAIFPRADGIPFLPPPLVAPVMVSTPTPAPAPTPAPSPAIADTRARFGLGTADSSSQALLALLATMTVYGNANASKAGSYTLTTTSGKYAWVAVLASASADGVTFTDAGGNPGGWAGAGKAGNNGDGGPVKDVSSLLATDAAGTQWRFFRQDYLNASPTASVWTTA